MILANGLVVEDFIFERNYVAHTLNVCMLIFTWVWGACACAPVFDRERKREMRGWMLRICKGNSDNRRNLAVEDFDM